MTTFSRAALPPASPNDRNAEPSARLLTWPFVRLLMIQFTFGFSFSAFFLLPKYLELELAATPSQIGTVVGVGMATSVLAVPVVGVAIDRVSRRRLLAGGTLLGALAALAHCWVTEVGFLLYAARCAQGLAFVLAFNTAATLAVALSPKARLGQALGLFGVAMLCTNAIAPAIVEPLAASRGWPPAFMLAAGMAAIASLLALRVPHRQPTPRAALGQPSQWMSPRLLSICYAALTMGLGFGSIVTYIQPFALRLGETEVKDLFIGYTSTAILVRVVFGGVADRFGRFRVAVIFLTLYAFVTMAVAELQLGYLLAVGMGLGITQGMVYPALNAIALERISEQQRGLVMTLYNGSFNLGITISVLGFGALAEARGFPAVFIAAGVLVLSGVVSLVWPSRLRKGFAGGNH